MIDAPHILLIEDNPLDVRLLQEVCSELADWQIRFDHARSLTEAAEKVAASQHDAILLDLCLPESDGVETVRRLQAIQEQHEHSGAIIVLTSINSSEIGEAAITIGAQDFLIKGTLDAQQIQRSIRYACERQRLHLEKTRCHTQIKLMAAALDQASDCVIITDRSGDIQYVNQAFTRITGYSTEEVIGHNPSMLNSGKQSPSFYQRMWRAITNGEQWRAEMVDRHKDGTLYPCELEISPVKNEQGVITHFVGIQRDLTEHKLIENQLRQSQKLEAIGTLTAG
ncbi:MAG: PAS domain S-box protein, partial [Mariprofundales bacterium]|nr:PAS domain S-box protein [Mariprofundales bacterium]